MGLMTGIIIISVILLCFTRSAVWMIQDFYDNRLTAEMSDNGDGYSGDSCAFFSSARVNNEALPFLPFFFLCSVLQVRTSASPQWLCG